MDSLAAAPADRPEKPPLLRSPWTRVALAAAAVEAGLVVTGVVPRWAAVGIAVVLLVAYFAHGRRVAHASARQGMWAVAVSQGLVLLVPLALWMIGAAVVLVVALAAAIVLALLVLDR